MHKLSGKKYIILNESPFNKSILIRDNEVLRKRLHPISHNRSNNFIYNIAQTNRMKPLKITRVLDFGNESNVGVVQFFKDITSVRETMNYTFYLWFYQIPIMLEKID